MPDGCQLSSADSCRELPTPVESWHTDHHPVLKLSTCLQLALAQSWRTTEDVAPTWNDLLRVLDNSIGLSRHIRPGRGYNDMDGLEVCSCQQS